MSGDNGLRAEEGKAGEIVWTIRTPYVLVGGKLEIEGTDADRPQLPQDAGFGREDGVERKSQLSGHVGVSAV